ncbi:MobP3 family relaxase [Oscillospiraceae bacterium 50-60]
MPRIIFKCPYIKPGTAKAAAHLNNYVRYVATRDGTDLLKPDKAGLPATKKQRAMVERLLRDFPMCRGMFEYEDYQSSPTRAAASEFITRAIEDNYDQISKRENYVSYIAQRPRAERLGAHGLFNGTGDALELPRIAEEVANHPGNVWLPIISLRREDAARLGYDNARQWQALLSTYVPQIADAMRIPWEQFRWYASYHDEGSHPHVHMVCYSADGRSGFLDKEGIARIKSGLAKNIFRQELTEIYRQQTQRRDELVRQSGEVMKELIRQMLSGTLENPRIEQLMGELAQRLKSTSGRKQYGYLKAPLKAVVDEIVDELAKDARVSSAYDLWYQLREEVLRTYRDDLPERLPLSQQTEFKRIKNVVVEEAARLGEHTEVFTPADTQEPLQAGENAGPEPEAVPVDTPEEADRAPPIRQVDPYTLYRLAKRILMDPDTKSEQITHAVDHLTHAAEAGLDYAQYPLGMLYRNGGPVVQDMTQAVIWFSQAAEQGNQYAMYALGKLRLEADDPAAALRWFRQSADLGNQFAQYRLGKLLLSGDGVAKDTAGAVRWLTESAEQGNQYAQYALGKLYLLGKDIPQDRESAVRWLTQAAEQGNEYARFFLDHMDDSPSLFASATRLLHHMGRIFQEQAPPPSGGISFVDSKLRRKIREKKIAMGHKPNDHEEPEIAPRQI